MLRAVVFSPSFVGSVLSAHDFQFFKFKDKSHLLLKVDIHLKVIQVLNMLLSRALQKNIPKAA